MAGNQDLEPDWTKVPNWIIWVAIDASGYMFGFEGEPYPQRIIPAWMLKKSELRTKPMVAPLGKMEIPKGVKWQDLCWKRPEKAEDEK